MVKAKSITIRLTKEQKATINLLVKAGRYKDISSFVRNAIDAYLGIQNLEAARVFADQLEAQKKRMKQNEENQI